MTSSQQPVERTPPAAPTASAVPLTAAKNDFYALRHGQSEANVARIIASRPGIACHRYGLSPLGRQQAAQAGRDIAATAAKTKYGRIVLVTSDLLRAKQTAETVLEVILGSHMDGTIEDVVVTLEVDVRLRERDFGTLDGRSDALYQSVWDADAIDPSHTTNSVESVVSVAHRAHQVVLGCDAKLLLASSSASEQRQRRAMVVLVAHGDVLQILQTHMAGMPVSRHRTAVPHLETATLRPLGGRSSQEEEEKKNPATNISEEGK
jgi:glucosyl-3-phosphoglycerate phosphatase